MWRCLVGAECKSAGIAARTLANIADVLGALSRGAGGLRSGPASNRQWNCAFQLLEVCTKSFAGWLPILYMDCSYQAMARFMALRFTPHFWSRKITPKTSLYFLKTFKPKRNMMTEEGFDGQGQCHVNQTFPSMLWHCWLATGRASGL